MGLGTGVVEIFVDYGLGRPTRSNTVSVLVDEALVSIWETSTPSILLEIPAGKHHLALAYEMFEEKFRCETEVYVQKGANLRLCVKPNYWNAKLFFA